MTKLALHTLAMLLPVAAAAAALGIDRSLPKRFPAETLKLVFLECDRLSASTMVDATTAAHCSLVYEELLQREFGGDFNRLMDWWRRNRRRD